MFRVRNGGSTGTVKLYALASAAVILGLVVSPALAADPAPGRLAAIAATEPCSAWDLTYSITASLRVTDTLLGAGDGIHVIGPGTLVLHVEDMRATLKAFELREYFSMSPKSVLLHATVLTDATMRATPDASGAAGAGTLANDVLWWEGPIKGYRSDGELTCDGSLCGKFGAPPAGKTEMHLPPEPVHFQPWRFSNGGTTFQMAYTLISVSESPKERTYMALAGREASRTCVQAPER